MAKISEVDKNLAVTPGTLRPDTVLHDCRESCFSLHGLLWEGDTFRRIPEKLAQNTNSGVAVLHTNTAGGRLRFRTDSDHLAVIAHLPELCSFPHMPLTGSSGFDVYVDNLFRRQIIPPIDCGGKYDGIVELDGQMHEIMIGFPLYNDVTSLTVGLSEKANILPPKPYRIEKPVVFYGSSITQGGCASRPGTSYQAILSREMDFDYVNLGFSGSAAAEQCMAEYIGGLTMSAFVMDYDHNAASLDYLRASHEPFYRTIRRLQPDLPILMTSAPNNRLSAPVWEQRRQLIRENAAGFIAEGDKNLWYIDGNDLWGTDGWDSCTVDCNHPNDLGFWRMAKAFAPALQEMLYGC